MARPRGLGRGLSALIPEQPQVPAAGTQAGTLEIGLDVIDPNPFQPREVFARDALEELAQSIRLHGLVQPVVVRETTGGRYQLVVGERRLRAARLAGLAAVPALVRHWDDRTVMEVALIENLQRQDLNPMEEARAFERLIREFGWTQEDVGDRVGKSRSHVANYLRLLQLSPEIIRLLEEGALSVAHAKVLLGVDPGRRWALAERAARDGWTVRQLNQAAQLPVGPPPRPTPDAHLKAVEGRLRRRFGTRVNLKGSPQRGRIEIPYHSLDELERLLELLDNESATEGPGPFVV
jgi:ParB family chromosome partitioning protein